MDERSKIQIVEVTSLQNDEAGPSNDEDRPLLNLIKHLVNYVDIDQNTPLSNLELKDILCKELSVDINNKFESEVYMMVLKKFLKTWPRWDAVDKAVKKSKSRKGASIDIEKKLLNEYKILKKYLQFMIDSSKGIMLDAVEKSGHGSQKLEKGGTLEVYAKKEKLNNLFYNKPTNNTIINMNETTKNKIYLQKFKLEDLINCPFVQITVTTPMLEMTHGNSSEFHYTLINKVLTTIRQPPPTTKALYSQACSVRGKVNAIKNKKVASIINNMLNKIESSNHTAEEKEVIRIVLETLKQDLNILDSHEALDYTMNYKYYPVQFPYVRYHVTPLEDQDTVDSDKFDLHLEEYLIPIIEFSLLKGLEYENYTLNCFSVNGNSLIFKCLLCNEEFLGLQGALNFENHFNDNHSEEDDMMCTGCNLKFPYAFLARNWWCHDCPKDNDNN